MPTKSSTGLTGVGPVSHADGGDLCWLCSEFAPSVAGDIDDVVVGFEDEVESQFPRMNCQMFFQGG